MPPGLVSVLDSVETLISGLGIMTAGVWSKVLTETNRLTNKLPPGTTGPSDFCIRIAPSMDVVHFDLLRVWVSGKNLKDWASDFARKRSLPNDWKVIVLVSDFLRGNPNTVYTIAEQVFAYLDNETSALALRQKLAELDALRLKALNVIDEEGRKATKLWG